MQIKSLGIQPYQSWAINDKSNTKAITTLKKLMLLQKLKAEGYSNQASHYQQRMQAT